MTGRWSTCAALAALLLGCFVSSVFAGNPCLGEAKSQYLECQRDCREAFQVAKDGCLNRDHECMELCRDRRGACRDLTGIDEAFAACTTALRAAKQICRDTTEPDTDERDLCIDQAQVVSFQCRDRAREDHAPALKLCAKEFKACARACPPPDPPSEAIDPVQCKIDAKRAYKQCRAGCREELQFQRDACLNRDHACVEQCRTDRDTCRQPVEDTLSAATAACNTTRDDAVQRCHATYPTDPVSRDQCIDNAQVDAFRCRDQARENARPGFEDCRQRFRSCAAACPPA